MDLTHTASLLEVFWTVMVGIGLIIALRVHRKVVGDEHALSKREDYIPDGPRAILARSRIRTERVKIASMIGFVAIGVNAMRYPPPAGHSATNFSTILAASVFVLVAIFMILDTHLYLRDRERILDQLGEQ